MRRLLFCTQLALLAVLCACDKRVEVPELQYSAAPAAAGPVSYRLAPHPLYNPQQLSKTFQPLVEHLNRLIPGVHFELEGSRDYQVFEKKFRARQPEFLMPNPWQTLEAMKNGYHVIAMWGDAEDFKGLFITRIDSPVRTPGDLKGKAVSYPAPTALAAAIMPQYFLHSQGIDVNNDLRNLYVGSQESSIMSVFLGSSAAGATWPPPWRLFRREHPVEAAQLRVLWETPSLINNSVMVRDDVPAELASSVRLALLELGQTAQGRQLLAGMETARFHAADDHAYDLVRQYVARFEREVRPVEGK